MKEELHGFAIETTGQALEIVAKIKEKIGPYMGPSFLILPFEI